MLKSGLGCEEFGLKISISTLIGLYVSFMTENKYQIPAVTHNTEIGKGAWNGIILVATVLILRGQFEICWFVIREYVIF